MLFLVAFPVPVLPGDEENAVQNPTSFCNLSLGCFKPGLRDTWCAGQWYTQHVFSLGASEQESRALL